MAWNSTKKMPKGFAFGIKTARERNRAKQPKKKGSARKLGWGSKESEAEETSERLPVAPPSYEVQYLPIADIIVKGKRRALNLDKMQGLKDSIALLGLREPITVRLVRKQIRWGKYKIDYVLVDGLHRLETMKKNGHKTIPCFILKGDKRDARMWEISANLHRADLTPEEEDEQLAEWVRLFEADQAISGRKVQKKGPGRPKSGISEAARQLQVKGKTHEAKRKRVAHAVKLTSVFQEAKEAAKKASLNRSERLKVAEEKTPEAQVAKVRELSKQKKTKKNGTLSAVNKKILEGIIQHWNDAEKVKQAFIQAPKEVSEKFIVKMRQDWSVGHAQEKGRSNWV
jgi:ParB-like chromosome segregation protein Spo0J